MCNNSYLIYLTTAGNKTDLETIMSSELVKGFWLRKSQIRILGGNRTEKKKLCFVIMPFSKTKSCTSEEWTEIFENVHSLAIKESRFGYECKRSNIRPGAFIKDILTMLNQADVVLADLTDMSLRQIQQYSSKF